MDKPMEWTSHDVVAKMRRLAQTKRVGHLGTLDPLATGVLPLVLNHATRLSQFYARADKVYEAEVTFGFATNSYDSDGEPVSEPVAVELDRGTLEKHLDAFRGELQQLPPRVSAKKINGVPAYKLARKDQPVNLKPVAVKVHELTLLACAGNVARLRVHCGAGTYVRSIAHDLGLALGCGAHLSALRRTRAAGFTIEAARTIDELTELSQQDRLADALIPSVQLLPDFPMERVDDLTAAFIRQGRDFRVSPFRVPTMAPFVKAVEPGGALLAIGEMKLPNLYHPMLVF